MAPYKNKKLEWTGFTGLTGLEKTNISSDLIL
jgi:hypothetical protein